MINVPIENVPNQEFSISLDGNDFRIQLRTIQNLTFMSCWLNDTVLFYNQICTPNNWVNQYLYISEKGKFVFRCLDEEYPNYEKFNISQWLFFMTESELQELRASL